jgi:hypothetical protein
MRWNGEKSFGRAMANGISALRYALGASSKVLHGNRLYSFSPTQEAREKAKAAYEACGFRAKDMEEPERAKGILDTLD